MLVDEFADKHFAANIRVDAVDGKRIIHRTLRVVEVRLNVDKVILPLNVVVDLPELNIPIRVGGRVEGVLQVVGVNRHER